LSEGTHKQYLPEGTHKQYMKSTHKQYMKSLQQNNAATVEINIPDLKEGSDSVATKRFKVLRKYNIKGKPTIITPEDAAHLIKTAEAYVDPKKGSSASKRKTPSTTDKNKTELQSALKSSEKGSKNDMEDSKRTSARFLPDATTMADDAKPDDVVTASKATRDNNDNTHDEEAAKTVEALSKDTKDVVLPQIVNDKDEADNVEPSKATTDQTDEVMV
jgi:hypothetical protein